MYQKQHCHHIPHTRDSNFNRKMWSCEHFRRISGIYLPNILCSIANLHCLSPYGWGSPPTFTREMEASARTQTDRSESWPQSCCKRAQIRVQPIKIEPPPCFFFFFRGKVMSIMSHGRSDPPFLLWNPLGIWPDYGCCILSCLFWGKQSYIYEAA